MLKDIDYFFAKRDIFNKSGLCTKIFIITIHF